MSPLRTDTSKRRLILAAVALLGTTAAGPLFARPGLPQAEVWIDPGCGCCKDWIAHLEANGFSVNVYRTGNAAARQQFEMPLKYASCHTARIGGYTIEGHVPARDIKRLLSEKPVAVGLAVPAMPIGSPGMDGPEYGGRRDPYNVLLILKEGGARVFQAYS